MLMPGADDKFEPSSHCVGLIVWRNTVIECLVHICQCILTSAITQNFPTSCPSLVYKADMHGTYESKYPLLIEKTSFEVKHCKIESVVLCRLSQAPKLKKTHS